MKNLKLATIILFITAGTFIFSPARAVTPWQPISGGSGNSDGGSGSGSGSNLPIDGQAWFLIVAGLAIGCKVIVNKTKNAKTETINL